MTDILNRILARKAEEVAERRSKVPLAELSARNFGVDEPPMAYKGTMTRSDDKNEYVEARTPPAA